MLLLRFKSSPIPFVFLLLLLADYTSIKRTFSRGKNIYSIIQQDFLKRKIIRKILLKKIVILKVSSVQFRGTFHYCIIPNYFENVPLSLGLQNIITFPSQKKVNSKKYEQYEKIYVDFQKYIIPLICSICSTLSVDIFACIYELKDKQNYLQLCLENAQKFDL